MFWSGGIFRRRRSGHPYLAGFLLLLLFFHFGLVFLVSRQFMLFAKTLSPSVATGLGRSINAGGRSISSQAILVQKLMGDSSVLDRARVTIFIFTTDCPLMRRIQSPMTASWPMIRLGKSFDSSSLVVNSSSEWCPCVYTDEVGVSPTSLQPPLKLHRLSSVPFKTISLHLTEGFSQISRVREEQYLHRRFNVPLHSHEDPVVALAALLPSLTVQAMVRRFPGTAIKLLSHLTKVNSHTPMDSVESFSVLSVFPGLYNQRSLLLTFRSFNRHRANTLTRLFGLLSLSCRRRSTLCHRISGFSHIYRAISSLPAAGRSVWKRCLAAYVLFGKILGKTLDFLTGLGLYYILSRAKSAGTYGLKVPYVLNLNSLVFNYYLCNWARCGLASQTGLPIM